MRRPGLPAYYKYQRSSSCALALSTGGVIAAILLGIYAPGAAFLMLYGIAIAGMSFVWAVILLSHVKFRTSLDAGS